MPCLLPVAIISAEKYTYSLKDAISVSCSELADAYTCDLDSQLHVIRILRLWWDLVTFFFVSQTTESNWLVKANVMSSPSTCRLLRPAFLRISALMQSLKVTFIIIAHILTTFPISVLFLFLFLFFSLDVFPCHVTPSLSPLFCLSFLLFCSVICHPGDFYVIFSRAKLL